MELFLVILYFDDVMEAVEHQLICMDADEALEHLDGVFLTLHLPGAHPNYELDANRRPSALGLRRNDSEEMLAHYRFSFEPQGGHHD